MWNDFSGKYRIEVCARYRRRGASIYALPPGMPQDAFSGAKNAVNN
jgi:hypothetical protein